jgi:hypothetical protein
VRLDPKLAALDGDWRRAEPPLRPALELIAEVASGRDVRPAAVAKLLDAGIPRRGVVDVLHVISLFSAMNRVGDTLGFDATFAERQAALLKIFEYIFLPGQLVPMRWRYALYERHERRRAARRAAQAASLGSPSGS